MKRHLVPKNTEERRVAPHAGAWIETLMEHPIEVYRHVAPHAGAWIETCVYADAEKPVKVAPHAGAWIETQAL